MNLNGAHVSLKTSLHAKNIGARFRSARSLVPNLNRKSFCERHEINRYTMQSWENGLHVSKGKNVEKFIEALAREGISCTTEWLIDGLGEPARPFFEAISTNKPPEMADEPSPMGLLDEKYDHFLNMLMASHAQFDEETVKMQVSDESMAPKFRSGDWLLGIDISKAPKRAHQKYCLVELGENRYVARKVYYTKDNFLLTALDERVPSFNLALGAKIYEIIWHMLEQ